MKVAVYLQNKQPSSNHEKKSGTPQLRDILQNTWSVPSKPSGETENQYRGHDKHKVEGILEQKMGPRETNYIQIKQ